MISCLKMSKRTEVEKTFVKNGRILLEELITFCDGKCNPIRSFSAKELQRATNNYDSAKIIHDDCDYILYQCLEEDRPIYVKKYLKYGSKEFMGSPFTDVVIGSQISVHKNVLKLIGCCLETEHPILVYEFVGNETLSKYVSRTIEQHPQILALECKIKIAVELANALSYLHTALSRPVIHRDIRPANIILDKNYVTKLTDFSLSISIPDGQLHVEDMVRGQTSYMETEYGCSGYITEKVDVYLLGTFLLRILTGYQYFVYDYESGHDRFCLPNHAIHCLEKKRLIEVLHPVLREGIDLQKLQAVVTIALCCIRDKADERPTMTDVAKELKRIQQSVPPPC